ncbi:unnamed protein product [Dracunculus medinensis]|uniref:Thioredoxin n=1 Tax=Dracunculus medinensis TaxID=318479 RepID=A0A3P7Q0N4_DRAME|nr:unnamed protein product [Dracunculus medinensis]
MFSFQRKVKIQNVFVVENFEDFNEKVVNSPIPVLVDFYADWCGPCQLLGPRIEAKVNGNNGMVLLAKVNVDYAGDLAMDYDVKVVPTVLAFKDGNLVGRFEGDHPDDYLNDFIADIIEK